MLNLARSITKDGSAFSVAIDATDIVSRMQEIHNTSAAVSIALGRLTVAGSMMGALLKNDQDNLTLRIKGNGTAGNLIVVSNGMGFVKSYVDNPSAGMLTNDCEEIDIKKVVGSNGMLSVVKNIGLKQPYNSQVPLISGEIGEDITNYYATSEQIPTVCALGVLLNDDLWRIVKVTPDNETVLIKQEKTSYLTYTWDDRFNTEKGYNAGINDFEKSRIKDSLKISINYDDDVTNFLY